MNVNKNKFQCCICGMWVVGEYGNDPWPVDKHPEHKCCDECNANVVVPARLARIIAKNYKKI